MKVELEGKYTIKGTRDDLELAQSLFSVSWAVIATAFLVVVVGGITEYPAQLYGTIATMAAILLSIGLRLNRHIALAGAGRMAHMHQLAERLETKAWLLLVFRPTQDEAYRELSILAYRFNDACKAVADFHQRNPDRIGDTAGGALLIFNNMAKSNDAARLSSEFDQLQQSVIDAKANFWQLYSALKEDGFVMPGSWKDYLTHTKVSAVEEMVEGRNELPGQ